MIHSDIYVNASHIHMLIYESRTKEIGTYSTAYKAYNGKEGIMLVIHGYAFVRLSF